MIIGQIEIATRFRDVKVDIFLAPNVAGLEVRTKQPPLVPGLPPMQPKLPNEVSLTVQPLSKRKVRCRADTTDLESREAIYTRPIAAWQEALS